MKKAKSVIAILLCLLTFLSTMSVSAYAASVSASLGYNEPENSGDYAYYNGKVVKSSSTTKDEIRWMQSALNYSRVNEGLNSERLAVDGSFGPASKRATEAFQKAAGLSVDGKFGPATIKKMKSILNDGKYNSLKPSTTKTVTRPATSVTKTQNTTPTNTFKQQNIIQYNTKKTGDFITGSWATYKGNGKYDDTISSSGCGIVSLVSAVYNLGNTIEKSKIDSTIKEVFNWAYGKHWTDYTHWSLFTASDDKFGNKYKFSVSEQYGQKQSGNTDLSALVNHLKNNKGTAVVHVYGHFMAAVDYRVCNGKEQIRIFDPGPGDMGSIKRSGYTNAAGTWIDVKTLKDGATPGKTINWKSSATLENIEIDAYWLVSKK